MPWKKGQSGNPKGRRKDTRNHITDGIREIARSYVDDPAYRAALHARLQAGTAGPMELRLWDYGHGLPARDSGEGTTLPVFIHITF